MLVPAQRSPDPAAGRQLAEFASSPDLAAAFVFSVTTTPP